MEENTHAIALAPSAWRAHTHTHSETLTLSSKWTLNGARKLPELTAAVKSKTRLAHQQPNMWDLTWKGFGFWHAGDVNQFMRILAHNSVSLPGTRCCIADSSVNPPFFKISWSTFSKITGNREEESEKLWAPCARLSSEFPLPLSEK